MALPITPPIQPISVPVPIEGIVPIPVGLSLINPTPMEGIGFFIPQMFGQKCHQKVIGTVCQKRNSIMSAIATIMLMSRNHLRLDYFLVA